MYTNGYVASWFCLFGWFLNVLVNYEVILRTDPKTERLRILRAATHETELGDHDFCLSRSHYTDTDPTSRERAAAAGIEPGTSSPGVVCTTKVYLYTRVAAGIPEFSAFNSIARRPKSALRSSVKVHLRCAYHPRVARSTTELPRPTSWYHKIKTKMKLPSINKHI